ARGVGVRGLLNVQYALTGDLLYVLEANPRASRTVPFVSKATAVPLAKAAARIALGATIAEPREEGVLPATGDGAEMPDACPGEVMGVDFSFGKAFAKSQTASYGSLPTKGRVFVSVANRDKRAMVFPVKRLADLGFQILATSGTAEVLKRNGIACTEVRKHFEGEENIVDIIKAGGVDMVINTPYGN